MNNKNIDTSKSNIKTRPITKKKTALKTIKEERLKYQNEILTDINLIFGIDNGTTGTISAWDLKYNKIYFDETPVFKTLNYQKEIKYIDRINFNKLKEWFENIINKTKSLYNTNIKILAILERPMVNPQRFESSLNAVRALESTLLVLELLNIPYIIIDSKNWQHYFFGKNTLLLDLKKASKIYGIELLEKYKEFNLNNIDYIINISKIHGDTDALLIIKYAIDKLLKYSKTEK